jgi:hypothetical protein
VSYAISSDGLSWRAVASPDDCDQNETWSATPPSIPTIEVVSEPPQITEAQAAKLIAFLKANPDIVEAAQL